MLKLLRKLTFEVFKRKMIQKCKNKTWIKLDKNKPVMTNYVLNFNPELVLSKNKRVQCRTVYNVSGKSALLERFPERPFSAWVAL